MASIRFIFIFALVIVAVMAQDYEGGEFDPSGGQGGPAGLEQFGAQPDFSPEGGEQFEGGAEGFEGGFVPPQQGQVPFEGMQPAFAEESVQRVSRILPAMRN